MKRRRGKNLGLLFGSTFLALVLIEFCLRWIAPLHLKQNRYQHFFNVFQWNPGNTHFDEELGYFPNSDLHVPFGNLEFQTHVETNSWGFRDDEDSLRNPEILLLGDSFGFGWGVEEEETAASLLEKRTGHRVLNMSVSGYGTVQEFLLLQRFCEVEDVTGCVVVILYHINDRIENSFPPGTLVPTVRKEGGRLVFTPCDQDFYAGAIQAYKPGWATTLSKSSALLDRIVSPFFNPRIQWANKLKGMRNPTITPEEPYPGISIGPHEVLEYLLRVMELYSSERSLEVRVVLLPLVDWFTGRQPRLDYDAEKQILRNLGVPYRDLSDDFSVKDFYPVDRHLRPNAPEIRISSGFLQNHGVCKIDAPLLMV